MPTDRDERKVYCVWLRRSPWWCPDRLWRWMAGRFGKMDCYGVVTWGTKESSDADRP